MVHGCRFNFLKSRDTEGLCGFGNDKGTHHSVKRDDEIQLKEGYVVLFINVIGRDTRLNT